MFYEHTLYSLRTPSKTEVLLLPNTHGMVFE
jgi:hypothetical protein